MSLDVGLKKIRLILLEDCLILLLCLGDPGIRWMFSEPNLLQRVLPFHLRLGIFEDFVIGCNQNTKFLCPRYCIPNASSARGPCTFGSLAELAISVFWEESINSVFP